MPIVDAIRKRGFRRWYERQLIEGHAYLVTAFLSLIMAAITIEQVGFPKTVGGTFAIVTGAFGGGALMLFAWRQFSRLLFEAEYLASHATCPLCRTYARFTIERSVAMPTAVTGCTMDVHCRHCGHDWTIA